eukprot:3249897-Alexandrium_andersonii.AAC.1
MRSATAQAFRRHALQPAIQRWRVSSPRRLRSRRLPCRCTACAASVLARRAEPLVGVVATRAAAR